MPTRETMTRLGSVLPSCLAALLTAAFFGGGGCGGKSETAGPTAAAPGGSAATDSGAGNGGASTGAGGSDGSGGAAGAGAGGEAATGGSSSGGASGAGLTGGAGGDAASGGQGATGGMPTGGTGGAGGTSGAAGAAATAGSGGSGGIVSDGSAGTSGTTGAAGTGGSADPDSGAASVPKAGTIPIARPEPAGCIDKVGPGKLVFTGCATNITFNVSVPAQCLEKACGLIFDVHDGLLMNAALHEANTKLAELGGTESYIVVQPDGSGSSWPEPPIEEFLRLAMDVWNVEERRVHLTGFHTGGTLAFRMRCRLANVLASVAPASTSRLLISDMICPAGTPPLDALWIESRNSADLSGNEQDSLLGQFRPAYTLTVAQVLRTEQHYTWTRYANGRGVVFEFLQHDYTSGLGICILGGQYPGSGCQGSSQLQHGRLVLDFFIARPRWR